MSPTEYRRCAAAAEFADADLSSVREAVAAGEALDAATVERWREAHGIARPRRLRADRDRRGGRRLRRRASPCRARRPAAARGRRARGRRASCASSRRRCRRCSWATWTTRRRPAARSADGLWHTGDLGPRGRRGPALVRGPARRRDLVVRLPDRAGRGRVGAALAPCRRRGGGRRPARSRSRADRPRRRGAGARRGGVGRARRPAARRTSARRRRRTSTRARCGSCRSCRARPRARCGARRSAPSWRAG